MIETVLGYVANDGWRILIEESGMMPMVILGLFFLAIVVTIAVAGMNKGDQ